MNTAFDSSTPTSKERKYDRQLRLWAASGQTALESAHVLLVNSGHGAAGIETLKNLVLPGIGRFTIFDDSIVTDTDLGVNFFLDCRSVGRSRAQCSAEHLVELNPDVTGEWFPQNKHMANIDELLTDSSNFTIIICSLPQKKQQLKSIRSYSKRRQLPLLSVQSVGYYAYFTLELPSHFPIVETHPDEVLTTDLRLLNPWDELSGFARAMMHNLDSMDDHRHGHIPMIVLLLHYL